VASKQSKTTFAKLDRERRLREKREDKKARRAARKAGLLPEDDRPNLNAVQPGPVSFEDDPPAAT
jgi:hypothetical protein